MVPAIVCIRRADLQGCAIKDSAKLDSAGRPAGQILPTLRMDCPALRMFSVFSALQYDASHHCAYLTVGKGEKLLVGAKGWQLSGSL